LDEDVDVHDDYEFMMMPKGVEPIRGDSMAFPLQTPSAANFCLSVS
jgi:hypothetical protein